MTMGFTPRAMLRSAQPASPPSSLTAVGVSSAVSVTVDGVYSSNSYVIHHSGSASPSAFAATKLSGTEISGSTFYGGAANNNTLVSMPTMTWTGANGGSTFPAGNDGGVWQSIQCAASAVTESGWQTTIEIGTALEKLRVYGSGIDWNSNTGVKCRVTLNDGSGLTSVQTGAGAGGSNLPYFFEWTLNAHAVAQTATIQMFPATLTAGGPQIGYGTIIKGS